jgi:hypothetical protein
MSVFVVAVAPRGPVEAPELVGLSEKTATPLPAEVVAIPPDAVLAPAQSATGGTQAKTMGLAAPARSDASPLRPAYITSISCQPGSGALAKFVIEVWNLNADSSTHMLFNRFKVKLPDGRRLEDSAGSEVRPGQWLRSTFQVPPGWAGKGQVEYEVELTEPGAFVDYVHDSRHGYFAG